MARALPTISDGCEFDCDGLDRAPDGVIDGKNGIGARIKSAERRGHGLARLPGLWETAPLERVSGTAADHAGW